jgi:hypothetical protein
MNRSSVVLLLSILYFISGPLLACSFDLDCDIGSKCIKSRGSLYGICAGGSNPGNRNDDEPVYDSLDLDGTYGNTCSDNFDCGISNKCYKERGQLDGVCVKGR